MLPQRSSGIHLVRVRERHAGLLRGALSAARHDASWGPERRRVPRIWYVRREGSEGDVRPSYQESIVGLVDPLSVLCGELCWRGRQMQQVPGEYSEACSRPDCPGTTPDYTARESA